ncbi:MAG TPA: acetolactate synthase small subunit, partial [Sporomusaceae bacterium]|nr:acetolactate synthase small subunit [Sporomusaceae bacterium]
LLKINAGDRRTDVLKLAEVFRASVIDLKEQTLTLEITGDEEKIDAFTEVLQPYGILEMIRTGLVGLARGTTTIYENESCEEIEQSVL